MLRFCHRLKWVKNSNIWIGVEKFIKVVLSVDKLKFEELKLMPSLFKLIFSLLKKSLQFLNQSEVLLTTGSVIKKCFKFLILLLHERDSVFILLDHLIELFLYFLSPLNLFVNKWLCLFLMLSFVLLLSVLVLRLYSCEFIPMVFNHFLNLIRKLFDLVLSVFKTTFSSDMWVSLCIQLFS